MPHLNKTLVFTIALNGYQWLYKHHLKRQKEYAEANGYDYVAVTLPSLTSLGKECAWLKISLLERALTSGYAAVMYIDADADIKPDSPPVETLYEKGKHLYMAHGYSGRFNSGVILVRNHHQTLHLLVKLIENCEAPIPIEDCVGWGENGHVICYTKNLHFVKKISSKWNNNCDPSLSDHIRHYSAGPMRALFQTNATSKMLYWLFSKCATVLQYFDTQSHASTFSNRLSALTSRVCVHYSIFNGYCR